MPKMDRLSQGIHFFVYQNPVAIIETIENPKIERTSKSRFFFSFERRRSSPETPPEIMEPSALTISSRITVSDFFAERQK